MAPQRKLKKLTVRTWFRPARGGGKVSMNKNYPTKALDHTTSHRKWRVTTTNIEKPPNTQGKSQGNSPKVKVLESLVFVPYTRDSVLRKGLQRLDDILDEAMNSPGLRFVERCGGHTIVELLRTSNPWAKSLRCGR